MPHIPAFFAPNIAKADTGKECASTAEGCTDPNRPYFDGWGNQFAFDGTLINASCPNVNDPTTGQSNPECTCPSGSSIQGYDRDTNKIVCRTVTGCPYGDSIPLGPQCDKHAPLDEAPPIDFHGK